MRRRCFQRINGRIRAPDRNREASEWPVTNLSVSDHREFEIRNFYQLVTIVSVLFQNFLVTNLNFRQLWSPSRVTNAQDRS